MNKPALVISAVLTAFILAITGGVVYTVRGAQQAKAQAVQSIDAQPQLDPQSQLDPQPQLDPQLEQEIQQREANYQNLIAQANERLLQAQKTQQELQAQLNALQNTTNAAPQTPAQLTVDPEQAAQIAADHLKQSSIYSVETTLLYGESVYKVTFSSGDIAYVSMDGQFIGSQAAPVVEPSTRTLAHNGGGGDDHHESDDHDD